MLLVPGFGDRSSYVWDRRFLNYRLKIMLSMNFSHTWNCSVFLLIVFLHFVLQDDCQHPGLFLLPEICFMRQLTTQIGHGRLQIRLKKETQRMGMKQLFQEGVFKICVSPVPSLPISVPWTTVPTPSCSDWRSAPVSGRTFSPRKSFPTVPPWCRAAFLSIFQSSSSKSRHFRFPILVSRLPERFGSRGRGSGNRKGE